MIYYIHSSAFGNYSNWFLKSIFKNINIHFDINRNCYSKMMNTNFFLYQLNARKMNVSLECGIAHCYDTNFMTKHNFEMQIKWMKPQPNYIQFQLCQLINLHLVTNWTIETKWLWNKLGHSVKLPHIYNTFIYIYHLYTDIFNYTILNWNV